MTGRVVSIKSKSTANVIVTREAKSPLYGKSFVRSKKYLVDDQLGVKMGDIVEFTSCKPISKRKNWKIVKVLGKSLAEIAAEQMKEKAEQAISEVMPEEKEGDRVEGLGSSEEKVEKKKKIRKEKLAPKP